MPGDIFNGAIRIRVNGKMLDTKRLILDILAANNETKSKARQTGFDNKYFADSDKYIQTLKSVTNLQEEVCRKYNKSANNQVEYLVGKLALEYLSYHYLAAVDYNQGNIQSFEKHTANASNVINKLQNILAKIS